MKSSTTSDLVILLEVPPIRIYNTCMRNEIEGGMRYVVELGGVSYDERGYLRSNTTRLLGEQPKIKYSWSDLRNATQYYTETAARSAAELSDLDGCKVIIKTRAFDEHCNTRCKGPWLWECKGSV